ncbi:hypothetical protein C2S51_025258 [Perilla frutescens var. frutescens]|nr:hypothetical protein C2S51_025258 [Perilla frutescens var. frutescens]
MGPVNTELVPDFTNIFQSMELFDSREDLISWVRERAIPVGIIVIVRRLDAGSDTRNLRLVLSCERGGYPRVIKKKPPTERDYIQQNLDDDEGQYLPECNQWMLEVVCGVHNHPQAQYLEGHAYVSRLTSDEEMLVASLSSSHTRPKQILAAIQRSFPNNKSTIKTIYNVRSRKKYVEYVGRSQMQYLLGKLEEHGYYQYTRRCPQTDTVKDMFYAHLTSVKLLRAFPEVLLMDCMYKTNMYKLPLFKIVGVTSTSMTFSIACAYLEAEKEDNYIWGLTVLKGLMDQSTLPMFAETEARYGEMLRRAEVAHAKLKRFLRTSTNNLEGCWEKIHDLLETSFNAIKASFEKSVNVVQHRYRSPIFQFLRGTISIAALDKIYEEMKSIWEDAMDPLLCSCVLRTKCGLPCAHEIDQHVRSSTPFSLDAVDKFWRKLDMEPIGAKVDVASDIDNRWFETWTCANNMFAQADESARLLMLKRFRKIVTPSTTSMVEPDVQTKTRGRPKVTKTKADTSTKREKSAFEYTDSFNDSCSQVPDSFEVDTLLSQVLFTTRP